MDKYLRDNYSDILNYETQKFTVWFEQKHLKNKEVLRPEDLNFCVS